MQHNRSKLVAEINDVELVMQIEVQDRYAWYKNKEVGDMNHQMADLEVADTGRNFAISGESSVIEFSFNLSDLETNFESVFEDWITLTGTTRLTGKTMNSIPSEQ